MGSIKVNEDHNFTESPNVVATFYKFVDLGNLELFKDQLSLKCGEAELLGSIILAKEGINATVSGKSKGILNILNYLCNERGLKNLEPKFSNGGQRVFKSMRIRIRDEIVSLKRGNQADQTFVTGEFVDPKNWNQTIADSKTLVIDARNFYEHAIGTFEGSYRPPTRYFRELPNWVDRALGTQKKKKIAMFCTGGIRCEKVSSFLLKRGYKNIVQLRGGILKYLEEINPKNSLWRGECFVFDKRISVNHSLEQGTYYLDSKFRIPKKISDQ